MPLREGFHLQNDALSVRLLPALGAKLVSLEDRRSGREWLLPSQLPDGGYREAAYGADFSSFDTSGFDECLPNVAAGPGSGGGPDWPDHGELWSRPWDVVREGEALVCRIEGIGHPYAFTRRVALEGEVLRLDYELENLGSTAFPHLWSAHPLLQATPGMRILLPEGVDEVFVNGASHPELGTFGDRRPWPEVAPGLDLSQVAPRETGLAVKLFVPNIPEGRCALWDPETGHTLACSWDVAEIPHLGLWLCYGGWPDDSRPGHLTVALEPCTGAPDALSEAAARGWCPVLPPGSRATWTLRLRSFLHPGVTP